MGEDLKALILFFKKVLLPVVVLLVLLATSSRVSAVACIGRHEEPFFLAGAFVNNHLSVLVSAVYEKVATLFDLGGSQAGHVHDMPVLASQVASSGPGSLMAVAASYVIEPRLLSISDDGSADLLGQSAATLDIDCPGQSDALKLACAAVNGTVLQPGSVFPLSERIGQQLAANDLMGVSDSEGQPEDQRIVICRLVSTFYSAARQAHLGIVESTSYLWPSNYLLPGYDPISNNNLIDLQLANNGAAPLYISAIAYRGYAQVRIYGGRNSIIQDQPASAPVNVIYPPEKIDLEQIRSSPRYQGLIFSVPSAGKEIALTFDDGPDPNLTPAYLKVLRGEGVHATFFLVGRRVEKAPGMAAMIAGEGEEIGNHTMNHEYLTSVPLKYGEQNLIDTTGLIEQETHENILYFRPPGGRLSPSLIKTVRETGMKTVLWNIDPQDWAPGMTPGRIIRDVLDNLQPGAIVVMHEGKRQTLEALPGLIRELKQRGWRLVTISELLTDGMKAYPVTTSPAAKQT